MFLHYYSVSSCRQTVVWRVSLPVSIQIGRQRWHQRTFISNKLELCFILQRQSWRLTGNLLQKFSRCQSQSFWPYLPCNVLWKYLFKSRLGQFLLDFTKNSSAGRGSSRLSARPLVAVAGSRQNTFTWTHRTPPWDTRRARRPGGSPRRTSPSWSRTPTGARKRSRSGRAF